MWIEIYLDGFRVQAKVFDEGSKYGIDGGKISKLWIAKDGVWHCNYDRGWDIEPSAECMDVYKEVLKRYN